MSSLRLPPRQIALLGLLTVLGGAAGTWLRAAALSSLGAHGSSWSSVPWTLGAINFVGVVAATWLLRGPLRHHDPVDPTRVGLITGFLGGFTSYSSLWVGLALQWHFGPFRGLLVALAALVSGLVGAGVGLWAGNRYHP